MSVKDFKEGMIVGAKPFEEVYKKQEAAIRRVSEELNGKLDNIGSVMNTLIDDMNDINRKKLYDLNAAPVDLKSFEQEEKEFIVAGLYTLASQCKSPQTSPFQKAFVRSIQSYLGVKTAQIAIDMSKIASIDSGNKQKAIMLVFMEYLFLEKENFTFLTEYENCFADFSVSEKDREAILQAIDNIYKAVDSLGFIEKYGFVPEVSESNVDQNEPVELEDWEWKDKLLHIPTGKEKKFYGKRISLKTDVHCEGTLVFEKCLVLYNDETEGQIRLEKNAKLTMQSCTILGDITSKSKERKNKCLVQGGFLEINNSYVQNCLQIGDNITYDLNNCIVQYNKLPDLNIELFKGHNSSNSKIENCLVEYLAVDTSNDKLIPSVSFGYPKTVFNSTFRNVSKIITYGNVSMRNCHFENCHTVLENYDGKITDCLFEKCSDVLRLGKDYSQNIKRCQFVSCLGRLISMWGTIEDCEFYNIDTTPTGRSYNFEKSGLYISGGDATKKNHKPSYIRHCLFNGIYHTEIGTGFIECHMAEKFFKTVTGLNIENCTFKNCVTKGSPDYFIFRKNQSSTGGIEIEDNGLFKPVVYIDCNSEKWLENVNKEGNQAENVPIRYETGIGVPIGSRLNDVPVGVPGFTPDFVIIENEGKLDA